jgi:protein-S-isoprenylcysteine O-methyltransferase Ste14
MEDPTAQWRGLIVGAVYLGAVFFYILGLSVRNAYELLKRQGRVATADPRVFAVVFTSMCVMWLSWFAIGTVAPMRLAVPPTARWLGLGVVALGTGLSVAGMWHLGGVENIDHLVTTGLFSRIRHPMYIGFLLWIIGWCAYTGALTSLILAPFGIASVLWWRQLEESELSARYGSEYREYRDATWF